MLVFVALAAMIVVGVRQQKRRRRQLQSLAAELGMSFAASGSVGTDISSLLEQTGAIPKDWKLGRVRNLLAGQHDGADVLLFDCEYVKTGAVTGSSVRLFSTVACVRQDASHPWNFVHEGYGGGTKFMEVERMRRFLRDAVESWRRSQGSGSM